MCNNKKLLDNMDLVDTKSSLCNDIEEIIENGRLEIFMQVNSGYTKLFNNLSYCF